MGAWEGEKEGESGWGVSGRTSIYMLSLPTPQACKHSKQRGPATGANSLTSLSPVLPCSATPSNSLAHPLLRLVMVLGDVVQNGPQNGPQIGPQIGPQNNLKMVQIFALLPTPSPSASSLHLPA